MSLRSSPGVYLRCSENSTENPWNGLACRPDRNPSTMNLARRSSRPTWAMTFGFRYRSAVDMADRGSGRRLYLTVPSAPGGGGLAVGSSDGYPRMTSRETTPMRPRFLALAVAGLCCWPAAGQVEAPVRLPDRVRSYFGPPR